jgi:cobalamin biosynthesis Mg chelatase CobN
MTRTDVVASSRPEAPRAPMRKGPPGGFRRVLILPMALSVAALALPSAALAAEGTSQYNQTPSTPTTPSTGTTPPATTTPSSGTSPSKEVTSPSKEATPSSGTSPAKEASTPASTTSAAGTKASTLPFTGVDLRWSIVVGVLLMGAGFSIVVLQRRQRRDGDS